MWFIYLIFFILLSYIILIAYIRIKIKFWNSQPVFHIYNIWYWLNPPGIILHNNPEINKYTNLLDIKTYDISDINTHLLDRACNFIKSYYVQSSNTYYIPEKKNIIEYLKSCNNASYISIYQLPKLIFEKSEPFTLLDDIISVITARSLNLLLKGKQISIYYVDNLCVHPDYRKHGIAPKTIQTHYFNLRKNNSKIKICLFKREGKLNAIIPLTTYTTVCFNISLLQKIIYNTNINVIEIGSTQLNLLINFIYNQSKHFDCIIMPDLSNILNMIITENIYIYGVIHNNNLIASYAFRRPKLFYDNEEAIECFFSLYDETIKSDCFISGFNISLNKCKEKLKTNILLIENIGQSGKLIEYLENNLLNILFKSPTAFFLYNYASYTVPNIKSLIFY